VKYQQEEGQRRKRINLDRIATFRGHNKNKIILKYIVASGVHKRNRIILKDATTSRS
jgi:hypothetical protein